MNILFLTLSPIKSLNERGIYTDLLRKFQEEGHSVFLVSPVERKEKKQTHLIEQECGVILRVKTLNMHKTNIIEKGIGTLTIEYQYLSAIKKHFHNIRFDIVIYSTPPITFQKVIAYIKKRDHAYSYLLLKDIFPQNAVDLKMIKEKGIFHRFFRNKEKMLYQISDTIGCMSPANKDYILLHNKDLAATKVEVNPNTITPVRLGVSPERRKQLRIKYGLPLDKKILVYGGNLGIPQGIDFLLDTIENSNHPDAFFLIVGAGTEFPKMEKYFADRAPANAKLLSYLPKEDYDALLNSCDIGLIFLNKNFTIPNFPSRLLSYLEMKMPVIAATDASTDIGRIIETSGCGTAVLSGDTESMQNAVSQLVNCSAAEFTVFKDHAWNLLQDQYLVKYSYDLIINKVKHV